MWLVKKLNIKLTLVAVVVIVLFLIWVELAVGLLGTPWAGS